MISQILEESGLSCSSYADALVPQYTLSALSDPEANNLLVCIVDMQESLLWYGFNQ